MIIRLGLDPWWIAAHETARVSESQPRLFRNVNPPSRRFRAGMAASVVAHGCALLSLSAVAKTVFLVDEETYRRVYVYQPLSVHTLAMPGSPQLLKVERSPAVQPPSGKVLTIAPRAVNPNQDAPAIRATHEKASAAPPGDAQTGFSAAPDTGSSSRLADGSIRITNPADGVHDVVVVQSSPDDLPPGIAGALTGRPVQTVFLKVGSPKEWAVHYCVPHESSLVEAVNSMVIRLPNPIQLRAPYPLVTVLPPPSALPQERGALIYGLLDVSGRLTALRVVSGSDPEPSLLERLAAWVFRPASRDGAPVRVELVLSVPPASGYQTPYPTDEPAPRR